MICPNNHKSAMETVLFHNVEVDYCPECLGVWFDQNELEFAKEDADAQLNWLDIDVWRDKNKFAVSPTMRLCPVCRIPLFEVGYDSSRVTIDFCKHCQGIWLDRGEFKQLMVYLTRKSDYEILHHYVKNLVLKLWEVFTGPKKFREELAEFLVLVKLLNYKFTAQHPVVNALIEDLPK